MCASNLKFLIFCNREALAPDGSSLALTWSSKWWSWVSNQ